MTRVTADSEKLKELAQLAEVWDDKPEKEKRAWPSEALYIRRKSGVVKHERVYTMMRPTKDLGRGARTVDNDSEQNTAQNEMQDDNAMSYLDESIPYYEYAQPQAPQAPQPLQPASAISSAHSAGDTNASGEHEDAAVAAGDELDWRPRRSRSRLFFRIGGVLGALLIILAGSYALFLHVNPGSKAVPQHAGVTRSSNFHAAACPFQVGYGLVVGRDVQCGYLTVPEDRSQAHGRTIQLAVAIYTIPGGDASAAPFLYLQGGPGGSLLSQEGPFIDLSQMLHFAMGSNFILLDQRGTGYSTPSLDCPELSATQNNLAGPALAAQSCHDRLVKSGINLQAYTTLSDAADVHDLIHALGYKQVNLYGVSYGTRLALTVMRLFPADIRSVILDSTLPTQANLFTSIAADTQRAFNVLFQGCAASLTCNAAYPHLASTFYALVTSLDASPAVFQDNAGNRELLNGDGLINTLHSAQYDTSLIPQLPSLIAQVNEGNYSNLASLANRFAFDALAPPSPISYGMYYSVVCGEDMDFITSRGLDMTVNGLQPQIKPDLLANLDTEFSTCSFWGQHPAPAVQKLPVTSAIPTLILAGEYDPATPPINGQQVARTLSQSYFFQFPGTGHGVFQTNICPNSIVAAFLQQPTTKPDASCIQHMHEPAFD